jgi:hypothetical protein
VQGCCPAVLGPLLFPGKQSPAEGGLQRGVVVILHGEARSGMHSHWREAGLTDCGGSKEQSLLL